MVIFYIVAILKAKGKELLSLPKACWVNKDSEVVL